jgi:ATP-binding protein involved in chromosome partitioning
MIPLVSYGIKAMSMGFLLPQDAALVWRGLMIQKALQQMLFSVEWAPLRYLIIDMPPGTGDVPITIGQHVVINGSGNQKKGRL